MDVDASFKIMKYLKDNGEKYDESKVMLFNDSKDIITITKWDYDIEKPSLEYLESLEKSDYSSFKKTRVKQLIIPVVKDELDTEDKEGSIVYHDGKLKIFVDNSWKSFSIDK